MIIHFFYLPRRVQNVQRFVCKVLGLFTNCYLNFRSNRSALENSLGRCFSLHKILIFYKSFIKITYGRSSVFAPSGIASSPKLGRVFEEKLEMLETVKLIKSSVLDSGTVGEVAAFIDFSVCLKIESID